MMVVIGTTRRRLAVAPIKFELWHGCSWTATTLRRSSVAMLLLLPLLLLPGRLV